MSERPLVSIIIPVFNAEEYITRTLETVASSFGGCCEIIIVNDGSTDNSLDVCNSFARQYGPEIKVIIINQDNRGVSAARNAGLCSCNGEYVYFVDADDEIVTSDIDYFIELLKTERYDMVIGGTEVRRTNAVTLQRSQETIEYLGFESVSSALGKMSVEDKNWIMNVLWNKFLRRDLIAGHHLEFKNICPGEDYEFIANCFVFVENLLITDKVLYRYFIRENNSLLHRKYELSESLERRKACWLATRSLVEKRGLDLSVFEKAEGFSMYLNLAELLYSNKHKSFRRIIICSFLALEQYYAIPLYLKSCGGFLKKMESRIFDKKSVEKIDFHFRLKRTIHRLLFIK